MPDRTGEIRTRHTSSRPCGCCPDIFYLLDENEELRREIADVNSENEQLQVALRLSHTLREDLHAENARLRKVADAAREWRRVEDLTATSLEYRQSYSAMTRGYRLVADAKSALLAALDALEADHV